MTQVCYDEKLSTKCNKRKMAAVGPVPMTLGGRQNQLEYLLQGSTNKKSVTNLLHRLRGLCDNPAPIELGEKEKLGETFSDHEIVYALSKFLKEFN